MLLEQISLPYALHELYSVLWWKDKLKHLKAHDIEWDSLMAHPSLVIIFDEVEEECQQWYYQLMLHMLVHLLYTSTEKVYKTTGQ